MMRQWDIKNGPAEGETFFQNLWKDTFVTAKWKLQNPADISTYKLKQTLFVTWPAKKTLMQAKKKIINHGSLFFTHIFFGQKSKNIATWTLMIFHYCRRKLDCPQKLPPKKPFKKIVLLQREFWVFGKLLLHCTYRVDHFINGYEASWVLAWF